ncbi:DUF935 domain-containing protein [Nevskia sp.]|uniref:DUF935 domain-containing protein n=1 Tax=Nevskia sp. TaxID=1929292 RepID=UPI003F702BCB
MGQSRILGPDGQPIETADLSEEIARGGVTGVRSVWHDSVARNLTPARLSALLEDAANGNADEYLTLAEEMEERELHYASVLGTRKRAVSRLPCTVESASDDADDVRIADDVRELTLKPGFRLLRKDMLDALGRSYSVHEIVWQRGAKWLPQYEWRDPRWFRFDRETGRELRLKDPQAPIDGLALQPYKWIVHRPSLKTGLPIRCGLARLVAFAWICKAYAQKDWNAFAEIFGLPLRIGRYGPGATAKDISVLRHAVQSLGSDAAAILPASMSIEFHEAAKNGGGDLYERLCDYLDRQISKAVLGQTMTADAQKTGLGSNNASVHNEVRNDIRDDDAQDAEETLNRDLVVPYVILNYGPRKAYPRITFPIREPEDLAALVKNVTALVPFGLQVEESVMRDRLGFPEPAENAVLLKAPSRPVASPTQEPTEQALNARQSAPLNTPDRQIARLAAQADPIVAELTAPIAAILAACNSFEEFRERVTDTYRELDDRALSALLTQALTAAQLAGRYELLLGV